MLYCKNHIDTYDTKPQRIAFGSGKQVIRLANTRNYQKELERLIERECTKENLSKAFIPPAMCRIHPEAQYCAKEAASAAPEIAAL